VPLPETPFGDVLRMVTLADGDALTMARESGGDPARLYAAAVASEPLPADKARRIVTQRVAALERSVLKQRTAALEEAIRQAEAARDANRVRELLREMMELHAQIRALEAA